MKKTLMLLAVLALASSAVMALTIDGYVTDSDTGEAIQGATVRFVMEGTCSGGCGSQGGNGSHGGNGGFGGNNGNMANGITVITDENGHYVINDAEAGIYNALSRKTGSYTSQHLYDLQITEDTSINFELTAGTCTTVQRLFQLRSRNNQ